SAIASEGLREDDEVLAYLPMAWVGDHVFSFAQSYCAGFCVSCPESGATVMIDLKELGPTYFFAPPRIWENILTQVMIRMEDAAWLKRKLFHYFLAVARRAGSRILAKEPVPLKDRLLYALGDVLVYGPLRNALYKSPGVFAGYYKNLAATASAKRADGWVHSGDAGFLGADGHLRIVDRAND